MADALILNDSNDGKMLLVQKLLREGKAKFQTARTVGYQTVDGLDKYAKSLGYVWNISIKNYELKEVAEANGLENPSERIVKILSMVEKGINLNDIAKYFRLKNSQELAEYMTSKDYVWDVEKNNYVKKTVATVDDEPEDGYGADTDDNDVDIMELLESNKGRLVELLAYKAQKTIPLYVVKGIIATKSFYISTEIDRLLKGFSNCKDVPQKDIIHSALIEYFQKYGYYEETRILLKS